MKRPRQNVVASVLERLRNTARNQDVPFNQILQFYAIERFLDRLSRSPHVDGVHLKGALLQKTVGIPRARPTLDIDDYDFEGRSLTQDEHHIDKPKEFVNIWFTMPAEDRIVIDPLIGHGKPVIRGTRVPVTVVVGSLAGG